MQPPPQVPHAIAVNPSAPACPILCANSWLCRVDTTLADQGDAPNAAGAANGAPAAAGAANGDGGGGKGKKSKKRKKPQEPSAAAADGAAAAAAGGGGEEARVVRRYGGMLLFAFLEADVALVVEQPWLRVLDLFPPALFKQSYGM